ncbi:MAG: sphinganine kinase lcb4 [Vezdaea aestivalis]|nr:MAG: sphinganine kinase lcb4 [Vezdaea aestivalis]
MTSDALPGANPFSDPDSDDDARSLAVDGTLIVGKNASLTLGTDSLVVLDEQFDRQKCCGLLPWRSKSTRAIPFFNVLWAEISEAHISIEVAHPISKNVVRPSIITYPISQPQQPKASLWAKKLLDKAYGAAQRNKRIKVLINPFGGKGSAQKYWHRDIESIFVAARCEVSVERTQYSGHAVEIAEKLDINAFDVVAACSGDGVPHEVFNGLGKRRDAQQALSTIAVVQLPCGSGNAMSWNLNGTDSPSLAALCIVKGLRMPLDLVSITQGDRRTLSFLSQSVGICAESDLGTDHLRWMGSQRFTYGILVRLLGKTVYPCELAIGVALDTKADVQAAYTAELHRPRSIEPAPPLTSSSAGLPPLQFGTSTSPLPQFWNLTPYPTLGNFYVGNMPYVAAETNFFPAALPHDGCADMVVVDGHLPRLTALRMLLAVADGSHFAMQPVAYRKVKGYRIVPKQGDGQGFVSIDGERFPFEPFQAEVHEGLGTVLGKSGHLFEAKGVQGAVL